jgi:two-component system sensor histidine kinase KdpD
MPDANVKSAPGEMTPAGRHARALATVAAASLAATPLSRVLDPVNLVMVFLLAVVWVAYRHGRGPAVTASILSVAAFDFFFVPPHLSFAVSDAQHLFTLAGMLVVGLLTGQLTADLRLQAEAARERESRSRELSMLANSLSGAVLPEQIAAQVRLAVKSTLDADSWLLLPDEQDALQTSIRSEVQDSAVAGEPVACGLDMGVARWAYEQGVETGWGTATLSNSPMLYIPLRAPSRTRGVLAVRPAGRTVPGTPSSGCIGRRSRRWPALPWSGCTMSRLPAGRAGRSTRSSCATHCSRPSRTICARP